MAYHIFHLLLLQKTFRLLVQAGQHLRGIVMPIMMAFDLLYLKTMCAFAKENGTACRSLQTNLLMLAAECWPWSYTW